ncbi:MAG: FAD-binding protein [bacterium]
MGVNGWQTIETDVLVLGSGGAGLCAALHMADAPRPPRVVMAVKGLFGKSGCTRMVQGGYNAVLRPPDSIEAHFRDTLEGGQWLNRQQLAHTLVSQAPARLLELENRAGCFFDRNPDGTVRQKAFAGQTHDRTVHKGDLTGIEIVNRLSEQVAATETEILEEVRAIDLLLDSGGGRVVGALLLDMRRGTFIAVQARATLLATGGGPTMYKISAPSHDKSCDGIAMAYRAGAPVMDMEMVQFHPTGLLAGENRISGTVLEEGLRGAGAYLLNGLGERFMEKYDPRGERATRDVVSRACYREIVEGRGAEGEAVLLDISHLGAEFVESNFRGMTLRCRDVGFELGREPVTVSPTAHFMMGGVPIDPRCFTALEGLFAAGEDASGVHGANRLGGNGVAESTVFGGIAGDAMAQWVAGVPPVACRAAQVEQIIARCVAPFSRPEGRPVYRLLAALRNTMWLKAGVVRDGASLEEGLGELERLGADLARSGVPPIRSYNLPWMDFLNMENFLLVSDLIARSALARRESRGAHFRNDFPQRDDENFLCNLIFTRHTAAPQKSPVAFDRLRP